MKRRMIKFTFGATFGPLLARFAKPRRAPRVRPAAEPSPRALFALIQTRPRIAVLAISPSEDELLKEINELNSTWNHWDLRTENHRFEIQRVPVVVGVPTAVPAVGTVAVNRR